MEKRTESGMLNIAEPQNTLDTEREAEKWEVGVYGAGLPACPACSCLPCLPGTVSWSRACTRGQPSSTQRNPALPACTLPCLEHYEHPAREHPAAHSIRSALSIPASLKHSCSPKKPCSPENPRQPPASLAALLQLGAFPQPQASPQAGASLTALNSPQAKGTWTWRLMSLGQFAKTTAEQVTAKVKLGGDLVFPLVLEFPEPCALFKSRPRSTTWGKQ